MPFPPAFDNIWDITQPPDTQAANLLGQDIRNLKDDIMQRMSLLSGTLANRPTPETVSAVWGGSGFGILYFSTDTQQTFQWTGVGGWVDVTGSVGGGVRDFDDFTRVSFVNIILSGVPLVIRTIVIPIGAVRNSAVTSSYIELEYCVHVTSTTVAPVQYYLLVAGTQVLSLTLASGGSDVIVKGSIALSSALNPRAFVSAMQIQQASTGGGETIFGAPIDGTAAVSVVEQVQSVGGGHLTANFEYAHIRVRR